MTSKLKICTASTFACVIATACGSATDAYKAPKVGATLDWTYQSEGDTTKEIVTIVATGPDYAIFRQPGSGSEFDPEIYFVEFSGIEFAPCDGDMLTATQRQMFADAWPLTIGTVLNRADYTITVEEESSFALGSTAEPIFNLRLSYKNDEPDDVLKFSPRLATVIAIDWGNGATDRLQSFKENNAQSIEVQPGHEMLVGLDVTKLGTCGALLAEPAKN